MLQMTAPGRQQQADDLKADGVTVLRELFSRDAIRGARDLILDNRHLFKRTRPTPSAGHLAGFHHSPALEPLHQMLIGNRAITDLLDHMLGAELRTIGLTDITINRSQPWHVDLLRGKYRHHLEGVNVWGGDGGGIFKILLYLNDSNNLKVIRGSHRKPISLEHDGHAEPAPEDEVVAVPVREGDVVIMDLRCRHRGADEAAYASGAWDDAPRMLVSTVLGGERCDLTRAMEAGNAHRYRDWSDQHS